MSSPQFAALLRRRSTDAERKLWLRLRARQIVGMKFRRQHPIGPYIVDFICIERRIVIEVDGGQHQDCIKDRRRDAWLASQGLTVLRFWDNEILKEKEGG